MIANKDLENIFQSNPQINAERFLNNANRIKEFRENRKTVGKGKAGYSIASPFASSELKRR